MGAFVPFVEGSDGDEGWFGLDGCGPGSIVVGALFAVAGVAVIPGSDAGIDVAGGDAWDEEFLVFPGPAGEAGPVLEGGSEREAVGGEIGVEAIEVALGHEAFLVLFDPEADDDCVVGGIADGLGTGG